MTGIEGRMYRPLAAAVVATLAASLLLALTTVPALAARLLRTSRSGHTDVLVMRWIKRMYAPLLDKSLSHAGLVRIASVIVAVPLISLGASPRK